VWTIVAVLVWYLLGDQLVSLLGFELPEESEPVIGLGFFVTPEFIWFYAFIAFFIVTFAAFWFITSPHPWQWWSVIGSAVILFSTYFSVQVSVALNHWRRPFFDLLQSAFDTEGRGTLQASEFFDLMLIFAQIAFVWVIVYVLTRFLTSHFVFRWRTAMNDYYMSKWSKVRHIEGASQRVQEDTMRFADIVESLGIAIVDSIMTLFAFLPLLLSLSVHVTELPIVGAIPAPLVVAAILWAAFGTTLLAVVGIKLPGLKFKNQRVEAAYRKELVYGEDSEEHAQPATVAQLFNNVRKNYFRIFFHFTYFNIARSFYIQADSLFTYILMIPTIVAGARGRR